MDPAETTVFIGNLVFVRQEEHLTTGREVPKDKCLLLPKGGITEADKLLRNPENFQVGRSGLQGCLSHCCSA